MDVQRRVKNGDRSVDIVVEDKGPGIRRRCTRKSSLPSFALRLRETARPAVSVWASQSQERSFATMAAISRSRRAIPVLGLRSTCRKRCRSIADNWQLPGQRHQASKVAMGIEHICRLIGRSSDRAGGNTQPSEPASSSSRRKSHALKRRIHLWSIGSLTAHS